MVTQLEHQLRTGRLTLQVLTHHNPIPNVLLYGIQTLCAHFYQLSLSHVSASQAG